MCLGLVRFALLCLFLSRLFHFLPRFCHLLIVFPSYFSATHQWVLRGHKGFTLTKEEVANGISAEEFICGFVVHEERGTFEWVEVRSIDPSNLLFSRPIHSVLNELG